MATLATTKRYARRQLAGLENHWSPAVWRRALATVVAVVVALAAVAVFVVAVGAVDSASLRLTGLASWLAHDDLRRLSVAAGSLGVGVIALALIGRRTAANASASAARHVIDMGERGVVYVNSSSVAALAAAAVRRQPGAIDAEVRVRGTGASPIRLQVRMVVMPGTSLTETGRAAQDAARDAATRLAGLSVQDVNVEVVVALPQDLDRVLE